MWRPIIYGILMWLVTIYAFRRGAAAEKLAAIGIVIDSYLSALLLSDSGKAYQHMESSVVLIDLGLFVLLLLITLQSRRFWPLWLTAIQGVVLLGHFAPYVHTTPWIYQRAVGSWAWLALLVLAFAIRRHSSKRIRMEAT